MLRKILVEVRVDELVVILALVALLHPTIGAHWHILGHASIKVDRLDLFLAVGSDG